MLAVEREPPYAAYGNRLKAAREAAGLSQKELAARMKAAGVQIGQTTLSEWERGVSPIPLPSVPLLARLLSVPIRYFTEIEAGDGDEGEE